MIRHKLIDVFRRATLFLFGRYRETSNFVDKSISKVLVVRPNHRLGNQLLLTPLLQEIERLYPAAEVSLLVKGGAGPAIFKSYKLHQVYQLPRRPLQHPFQYVRVLINALTSQYDIAFNTTPSSSSGRLFTSWARAKIRFLGRPHEEQVTPEHMGKEPVYDFRGLVRNQNGNKLNIDDHVDRLDLRLSNKELDHGYQVLKKIFVNEKPTISLYTYATGKKIYSGSWWHEFHLELKRRYPDHNILEILPVENVSQLSFTTSTFYSRDIREIASVVANSAVFIGADSGIMHLAASSGTPTIGLFKVTALERYAPYGNGSFAFDTNKVDINAIVNSIKKLVEAEKVAG